jgi:hypothetical protein
MAFPARYRNGVGAGDSHASAIQPERGFVVFRARLGRRQLMQPGCAIAYAGFDQLKKCGKIGVKRHGIYLGYDANKRLKLEF